MMEKVSSPRRPSSPKIGVCNRAARRGGRGGTPQAVCTPSSGCRIGWGANDQGSWEGTERGNEGRGHQKGSCLPGALQMGKLGGGMLVSWICTAGGWWGEHPALVWGGALSVARAVTAGTGRQLGWPGAAAARPHIRVARGWRGGRGCRHPSRRGRRRRRGRRSRGSPRAWAAAAAGGGTGGTGSAGPPAAAAAGAGAGRSRREWQGERGRGPVASQRASGRCRRERRRKREGGRGLRWLRGGVPSSTGAAFAASQRRRSATTGASSHPATGERQVLMRAAVEPAAAPPRSGGQERGRRRAPALRLRQLRGGRVSRLWPASMATRQPEAGQGVLVQHIAPAGAPEPPGRRAERAAVGLPSEPRGLRRDGQQR